MNVVIDIKRMILNKTNNKDGLLKLFLFLNRVILKYSSKVIFNKISAKSDLILYLDIFMSLDVLNTNIISLLLV